MTFGNRSERSQKGINMEESASMNSEMARARSGRATRLLVVVVAALSGLLLLSAGAQAAVTTDLKVESLDSGPRNSNATPATVAGGHPWSYRTNFLLNKILGDTVPAEGPRDIVSELPPGVIGNALKIPKCRQEDMNQFGNCPRASQVGTSLLHLWLNYDAAFQAPIYNLYPPPGMPAQFGVVVFSTITHIDFSVRSDSDYGVNATIHSLNPGAPLSATDLQIWGIPGDPSHDAERLESIPEATEKQKYESDYGEPFPRPPLPRTPLLTDPTSCGDTLTTALTIYSWQRPQRGARGTSTGPGLSGCDQIDFSPTIQAKPTTNIADAPAGLEFHLHLPQNEDPDGLGEATLKEAKVTLPAGVTVNPSSANGLGACSPSQIGMTTPVGQADAHFSLAPATCPPNSKIGNVRIDTPLIDHPLQGDVYLATQGQNPFGSLLAVYIAAEDEKSGIGLKLPGKIEGNPVTGQLTTTFANNPQLPFEDLQLNFFEGSGAPLKTAMRCGTFTTATQMTPWTSPEGADATPGDSFQINRGAGGGSCVGSEADAPKQMTFLAGTQDPTAGAYSPFALKLSRQDGTQQLTGIDTTLPKGLIAKLAGVPYCSNADLAKAAAKTGRQELASSSCPAASKVGSVNVGAGAGPTPFYTEGSAYLAGPYKGAPLSLAVVTPAVAGPFDLGDVVVRNALYVDPETTEVRAVSDPLPSILQGIPLDLRAITVNLDRSKFTRNPTNCNPLAVTGSATTLPGQSVALSNHFQVGDCGLLAFKPKLALSLKGGTKRSDHPALKAVLTARDGEANIAGAAVTLPRSEFLDQSHIKTICTRVQFAANNCPARAVYGKARAFTPLLDKPLEGPVYLRSSSHELPDLVADLKGQLHVVLVGRIDSVNRGIRNTFEMVPDAPVSKFVLEMQGGKKGLLVNNRDLCKTTNPATVLFDGQNGKTFDSRPLLSNSCKKAGGKSKGSKRRVR
ncbi:MAG TPA: hypothetical protein VGO36_06575 [Solirubrobacterales bacterium]|jgi:hypothetical protein|nr:hypothetical protein [Solirubrobacterales bacterium]